jgi:predicted fused transcriptional regulator/phosphomethylpyrimidine kinase
MAFIQIDLDEFNDHELIDEIEARGYKVLDEERDFDDELEDEEKDWICQAIIKHVDLLDPVAMSVYEKLRKR